MNIQTALDNIKVVSISPVYDYKLIDGGIFDLKMSTNGVIRPHTLKYTTFLEWLFKQDEPLYSYFQSTFEVKDQTVSHIVEELYDIGFDVDQSVKDYFEYVKSNVDKVILTKVLNYLGFHEYGEDTQD